MQPLTIPATPSYIEHDEETFHSLLDLEHQHCMQSGQAFRLLLCRLSTPDETRPPMNHSIKSTMVSTMREALGETDQIGWFLQDRVLGALLLSAEARQSAVPNSTGRNRVRRQIEHRLTRAHPSLIVQLYEFCDFPRVRGEAHVRPRTRYW